MNFNNINYQILFLYLENNDKNYTLILCHVNNL